MPARQLGDRYSALRLKFSRAAPMATRAPNPASVRTVPYGVDLARDGSICGWVLSQYPIDDGLIFAQSSLPSVLFALSGLVLGLGVERVLLRIVHIRCDHSGPELAHSLLEPGPTNV